MRNIVRFAVVLAVLAAGVLSLAGPASAAPDDGTYKFFNGHNNLCIDVAYGSTASGARVQQWDCYGGPPEQWHMVFVKSDGITYYYELKNINSGKCLDAPWGLPGVALQQMDCWGGDMQLWAVEMSYPLDGAYRIRNLMASYQCVSADTTYGRGASLWLQPCQPNDFQEWRRYTP